jgi:hypothetical protein
MFPEKFPNHEDLWTLPEVERMAAEENAGARARWPHVTTECIATDRVYWPGMFNAVRAMTGLGISGEDFGVTYRGLGREFAAAVQKLTARELRVVVYNMAHEARNASIVPWLLSLGAEYRFEAGPKGAEGHSEKVLLKNRGQEIRFQIPARAEYVIQMKMLSEPARRALYPDLALSEEDIRFVPEYRRIDVTVHNIGSADAHRVTVVLAEGTRELGRQMIPHLGAPLDLDPKTVRVSFDYTPDGKPGAHEFHATIDPDARIEELTRANNQATAAFSTPLVTRKQHASP